MSIENTPKEFQVNAKILSAKSHITKREFIDLCMLTVEKIEAGETDLQSRSDMAYELTGLWLRHENISDGSITNDIGGQFSDWEIPGTFIIDDDLHRPYWLDLKKWITEANEKYKEEPK